MESKKTPTVGSDEWGSAGTTPEPGGSRLIELRHKRVILIGTLEQGSAIAGSPTFRIATFDEKTGAQTMQEILFFNIRAGNQGVQRDDRVEIHGHRTQRGYIRAESVLNLDTNVRSGKILTSRPWLLVLTIFLAIFGAIFSKSHAFLSTSAICIVASIFFFLLYVGAKKKTKFISEQVKK
jgi:hypothetical protein